MQALFQLPIYDTYGSFRRFRDSLALSDLASTVFNPVDADSDTFDATLLTHFIPFASPAFLSDKRGQKRKSTKAQHHASSKGEKDVNSPRSAKTAEAPSTDSAQPAEGQSADSKPEQQAAQQSNVKSEQQQEQVGSRTSSEEKDGSFFFPVVDIAETDGALELHVELPGVKKEAISVEAKDGVLSISGRRAQQKVTEGRWHRVERSYGRFTRAFRLPEDADDEAIAASFENGVLRVTVPKRPVAEQQPKRIHIQ